MSYATYSTSNTNTDDRDYYLTNFGTSFSNMWRRSDGRSELWLGCGMLLWGIIGLCVTSAKYLSQPHWAFETATIVVGLAGVWASLANATDRHRVLFNFAAVALLLWIQANVVWNFHTLFQGSAWQFMAIGMAATTAIKKSGRPGVWCRGR